MTSQMPASAMPSAEGRDDRPGASPAAATHAREETDVQSQIQAERSRLLKDTTICALLCPARRTVSPDGAKSSTAGASPSSKVVKPVPLCGSRGLFRFADTTDCLTYVVAIIAACGMGAIAPLFAVIFGDLLDALNADDPAVITTEMNQISLYFLYLALAAGFCTWAQTSLPTIAAERQAIRMRAAFAEAVLRQDVTYFETEQDPAEVASLLVDASVEVVNGTGDAITTGIQAASTTALGLTLGFVAAWDMALVIMAVLPLFSLPILILKNSRGVLERVRGDGYARAQSVANEALSNIRTVRAFRGSEAESRRYNSHLDLTEQIGIRAGRVIGLGSGMLWLIIFGSYAAGMAFGAHRIRTSRQANPLCVCDHGRGRHRRLLHARPAHAGVLRHPDRRLRHGPDRAGHRVCERRHGRCCPALRHYRPQVCHRPRL